MQIIFHWFYCLPILNIVALLLTGTVLYIILRKYTCGKRYWFPFSVIVFCAWIFVVFYGTILNRPVSDEIMKPIIKPFYSYYIVFTGGEKELLRENFMNIILFYPAGLLACELLPKSWNRVKRIVLVVCLSALMSLGIEFFQFRFALGQAEVDDIIHNTLGALIGAFICQLNASFSAQSAVK